MVAVAHLARCRQLQQGLERAGKARQAASLKHVLDELDAHFAQPAGEMPQDRPAFFVMVNAISRYGDVEPRLAWGNPHPDRYALLGPDKAGRKFACYPVHDGGPLLPAEPVEKPAPAAAAGPWPFPVSAHEEPACRT